MYKIITSLFLGMIFTGSFAESDPPATTPGKSVQLPPADCGPAKDSLKKRLTRGELSFYNIVKYTPGTYNYITIDKNKYSRVTYPKGYPSLDFIACYNKEMKKTMDDAFKVDFFNKADSILSAYDHTGRGYNTAEFPGGPGALQKFLGKNIALGNNVKTDDGKPLHVFYSFDIDDKGNIANIKLVKSNCKTCEEPVLAAIKKMPAFIPARDAGVPKVIKYILPYMQK